MNDITSKQIGPYQITLKIHESPMKTLYRAYNAALGREVTFIVILPGHLYPSDLIEKIKAHAIILAGLKHLSIAPLLDCEVYDGLLCLVYDVVPKSILKRPIQQTYDWSQAARLLVPISQGLAYAHQKQTNHLSLSFTNILVSREGALFLYDFGIDSIIQTALAVRNPGLWSGGGNVCYMPPEQVLHQALDNRCDVFAFGMIYYELIFGKPRFRKDNLFEDLVSNARPAEMKKIDTPEKALPDPIKLLISKLIAPNRNHRFNSMLEVSVLFTRIALGHKIKLAMVKKPLRTIRPPMKPTTVRAIWAASLLVALFIAGFLFREPIFAFVEANQPQPPTPVAQVQSESVQAAPPAAKTITSTPTRQIGADPQPTLTPTAKVLSPEDLPVLFGSALPRPPSTLSTASAQRTIQLARWGFGKINDTEISSDNQTLALASTLGVFLLDLNDYQVQQFIDTGTPIRCVAFSADGQMLATGEQDGLIRIWDRTTGSEILSLAGHTTVVNSIAFSPDGKYLASASNDFTVRIWETSDGFLLHTLKSHVQAPRAVAFTPDGAQLLSGGEDFTLKTWDYQAGFLIKSRSFGGKINEITFFPDGNQVALAQVNGHVELFDMAAEKTIEVLTGLASPTYSTSISPDGSLIAGADGNGKTIVWNLKKEKVFEAESKRFNRVLNIGTLYSHFVGFTSDGKHLISSNWDNSIDKWDTTDWRVISTYTSASYFIENLVMAPNNQFLAVQKINDEVDVYNLPKSTLLYQLNGKIVSDRSFSNDSRFLSLVTEPGTVKVYDAESGVEIYRMNGHSAINDIYYSDNGDFMAAGTNTDLRLWSMNSGQEIKTAINYGISGCTVAYNWLEAPIVYSTRFDFLDFIAERSTKICDVQRVSWMRALKFTKEGTTAVAGGSSRIQVWNYLEKKEPILMKNTTGLTVQDLAISDNGQLVAAAFDDLSIRIWDASSGTEIVRLFGHTQTISSILFTADSRYMISGSLDGTILIWGVQ